MNIGQAVRAALDPFGVDVDVSIETPAKKPRSERDTEMNQAQKEKVDKAREAKENMTTKAAERWVLDSNSYVHGRRTYHSLIDN